MEPVVVAVSGAAKADLDHGLADGHGRLRDSESALNGGEVTGGGLLENSATQLITSAIHGEDGSDGARVDVSAVRVAGGEITVDEIAVIAVKRSGESEVDEEKTQEDGEGAGEEFGDPHLCDQGEVGLGQGRSEVESMREVKGVRSVQLKERK